MSTWHTTAVVWVTDKTRGKVVAGAFGFAWWQGRRVFLAGFSAPPEQPLLAFQSFDAWNDVREFDVASAPLPSVLRFVRTGLYPA